MSTALSSLLSLPVAFTDIPSVRETGAGIYFAQGVIRASFNALLLLYFFKRNVRAFCGLQSLSVRKAMLILVGVSITLLAAIAVITFVIMGIIFWTSRT